MKELKDYLHLYPDCDVMFGEVKYKLWYIRDKEVFMERISEDGFNKWNSCNIAAESFKPILRPLSDMTEDERLELHWKNISSLVLTWMNDDNCALKASEFKYLLDKHFDLFGLIESGLAYSKTTLK